MSLQQLPRHGYRVRALRRVRPTAPPAVRRHRPAKRTAAAQGTGTYCAFPNPASLFANTTDTFGFYNKGFKPNGLANEIGAVRGVRCQVRETGENKTADVGTANALNPNPNGTANTLNPNPKAARKKSPSHTKSNSQKSFFGDGAGVSEPWFCGEACRRKDVTK